MAEDAAPLVHCFPASFYSQKVLFALAEKGVTPRLKLINMASYEEYSAYFLQLNPAGQIPVLQHDGKTIADSKAITNYLDQTFAGPSLHTDPSTALGKNVHEMIGLLDSMAIPTLSYGSAFTPDLTSNVQCSDQMTAMRIKSVKEGTMRKALERYYSEAKDPAIRALYEAKMAAPPPYPTDLNTMRETVCKALDQADEVFQKVEQQLAQTNKDNPGKATWLLGEPFTAADIALAVAIERLALIGFAERLWGSRPLVAEYRERLIAEKPNFVKCCMNNAGTRTPSALIK